MPSCLNLSSILFKQLNSLFFIILTSFFYFYNLHLNIVNIKYSHSFQFYVYKSHLMFSLFVVFLCYIHPSYSSDPRTLDAEMSDFNSNILKPNITVLCLQKDKIVIVTSGFVAM